MLRAHIRSTPKRLSWLLGEKGHLVSAPGIDPWYTSPANEWFRECVTQRLHEVDPSQDWQIVTDPSLGGGNAMKFDEYRPIIRVRPYLDPRHYQAGLSRSVLWVVGGAEWAPEFLREGARRLRLVSDSSAPPWRKDSFGDDQLTGLV